MNRLSGTGERCLRGSDRVNSSSMRGVFTVMRQLLLQHTACRTSRIVGSKDIFSKSTLKHTMPRVT